VAVTETFDALEIGFGDLAFGRSAPIHDVRAEPMLVTAAAPLFVEFGEPDRLDPERIGLIWELPPAAGRTIRLHSPLVSLAAHLLPLLAILAWPTPAPDIALPIPVQLVFERPPPPPPPPPPAPQPQLVQPPPPPGRLSSVDMGDLTTKDLGSTTSEAPAATAEPVPKDTEHKNAAASPTPPPLPAAKPTPPKQKSAFQLPKPAAAPAPRRAETPHDTPRAAQFAGPAANRDEYLAYLVKLTRQHIDLLPMSVIGNRSGETVVSVVVYANGLIGPLGVVRSSGYAEIDRRIEQMIAAVGRFPPLPQWYQGNAVQLELTLRFPEALER
jgi:hypothetical protein